MSRKNIQMSIKDRLRQVINELNLSVRDFSEKTGVPYQTLMNYLQGTRSPNVENLLKISIQTNTNLHWLLTGESEMFLKKDPLKEILSSLGDDSRSQKIKEIFLLMSEGYCTEKFLDSVLEKLRKMKELSEE